MQNEHDRTARVLQALHDPEHRFDEESLTALLEQSDLSRVRDGLIAFMRDILNRRHAPQRVEEQFAFKDNPMRSAAENICINLLLERNREQPRQDDENERYDRIKAIFLLEALLDLRGHDQAWMHETIEPSGSALLHLTPLLECSPVNEEHLDVWGHYHPERGLILQQEHCGRTLLHYAAQRGSTECLMRAIEIAPEAMNLPEEHGCTPLMWAVLHNQMETAQLLIEQGADTSIKHTMSAQEEDNAVSGTVLDPYAIDDLRWRLNITTQETSRELQELLQHVIQTHEEPTQRQRSGHP